MLSSFLISRLSSCKLRWWWNLSLWPWTCNPLPLLWGSVRGLVGPVVSWCKLPGQESHAWQDKRTLRVLLFLIWCRGRLTVCIVILFFLSLIATQYNTRRCIVCTACAIGCTATLPTDERLSRFKLISVKVIKRPQKEGLASFLWLIALVTWSYLEGKARVAWLHQPNVPEGINDSQGCNGLRQSWSI